MNSIEVKTVICSQDFKTSKGIKTVETVYDNGVVYLRTFIGKGQRERCYKSKDGDCNTEEFVRKVYGVEI